MTLTGQQTDYLVHLIHKARPPFFIIEHEEINNEKVLITSLYDDGSTNEYSLWKDNTILYAGSAEDLTMDCMHGDNFILEATSKSLAVTSHAPIPPYSVVHHRGPHPTHRRPPDLHKNGTATSYDKLGLEAVGINMEYIFLREGYDFATATTYGARSLVADIVEVAKQESDFNPNSKCEECISNLIVYAHGTIINGDAYLYIGESKYDALRQTKDGLEKNISQFFTKININFCKKAKLYIRSCNIGKVSSIKTEIENYYSKEGKELEVITYDYYILPSGFPNVALYAFLGAQKVLNLAGESASNIKG